MNNINNNYNKIISEINDKDKISEYFNDPNKYKELKLTFDTYPYQGIRYNIGYYPVNPKYFIPNIIKEKYPELINDEIKSLTTPLDISKLSSNFTKNIDKSIIIGNITDKKILEQSLKIKNDTVKYMILHRLRQLNYDYLKYCNNKLLSKFIHSNSSNLKDQIQKEILEYKNNDFIQFYMNETLHKLEDKEKFIIDNNLNIQIDYSNYLYDILTNLDKPINLERFDKIKVKLNYNKPIICNKYNKRNKDYIFALAKDSKFTDYIIKNTDLNEVIKDGFLVNPSNLERFKMLLNINGS